MVRYSPPAFNERSAKANGFALVELLLAHGCSPLGCLYLSLAFGAGWLVSCGSTAGAASPLT